MPIFTFKDIIGRFRYSPIISCIPTLNVTSKMMIFHFSLSLWLWLTWIIKVVMDYFPLLCVVVCRMLSCSWSSQRRSAEHLKTKSVLYTHLHSRFLLCTSSNFRLLIETCLLSGMHKSGAGEVRVALCEGMSLSSSRSGGWDR